MKLEDLPIEDLGAFAEAVETLTEDEVTKLLEEAKKHLEGEWPFVVTQPDARTVFHGDLFGDLVSVYDVWNVLGLKEVLENYKLVFLGNYVDRGPKQLETLLLVLSLKARRPSEVFVLRGNHEPYRGLEPLPHDFPQHLAKRFKGWKDVLRAARSVFEALPFALVVDGAVVAYHGGPATVLLRRGCRGLECVFGEPRAEVVEEILWNDPANICGWEDGPEACWAPSPRGRGFLWGPGATRYLLEALEVSYVVRGHTPVDGVKFFHRKRVVSVFTRVGSPFFNKRAGAWAPDFLDPSWELEPERWAVIV
ncbi:metallophosphoesterase family protein [Ignicoccus hospitalis]|uniref:Metallophosphoesterase n=1 Tax=Ignicoccus hospitalis (strain KIN4/I / DSM 18386 / JCM 14125) TaxID=453591 RepID=A8A8K4_IGNH4|nr:metallophosphoesterase family protein [Ignicoccus hospitalis]ABU81256.1 metallophosphoesterase [Ignicoccus hospitalis KIN4/I]HIH90938.1 serine/threonine protein phosphatase [Desulfurococcaceae archaeon]